MLLSTTSKFSCVASLIYITITRSHNGMPALKIDMLLELKAVVQLYKVIQKFSNLFQVGKNHISI
jgi:hypothetical protein